MTKLTPIGMKALVIACALLTPACDGGPAEPQFDSTPVASLQLVDVAPGVAPDIAVGETHQFTVVARDSAGNIVSRPHLEWQLYPMAATVDLGEVKLDGDGRMTGVEQGWVTLRVAAVHGGASAASWVYVRNPVASVQFSSSAVSLIRGDRMQLGASAFDAANQKIAYGARPRWESSNTGVATVDSIGNVVSVGAGSAYIRAIVGERRDSVPVVVRTVRYRSVSPSSAHTCGVTTTDEVVCAGSNDAGQLGFSTPVVRFGSGNQYWQLGPGGPRVVTGGAEMTAATTGPQHSCSLSTAGSAYCWGAVGLMAGAGQSTTCYQTLGSYECVVKATPVANGYSWRSLSAAGGYTCGVTTDARVLCWAREAPAPVGEAISWMSFAAGGAHDCGLSTDGTAYCRGANGNGNLGTGTVGASSTAVPVAGALRFTSIAVAGGAASCALTPDGDVYCWGAGWFLAGASAPDTCLQSTGVTAPCSMQPVRVPLPAGVTRITMASGLACAVTADGATYCWGPSVLTPGRVQGVPAIQEIQAGGGDRACGVTSDGLAFCWRSDLSPSPAPGQ